MTIDPTQARRDHAWMLAAIRLARRHEGLTADNPSVGCIIAGPDGQAVGCGVTARGGRPHAEVLALTEAGGRARGATAYVTLEPCAHHGRTPPCCDALIAAGIARVVVAVTDPDSRVAGQGLARLRAAGVEVVTGVAQASAARGLSGYLTHRRLGRPEVVLKLAVSADGALGRRGAGPLVISDPKARARTALLRARSSAILVGVGTVIEDDPLLTNRLPGYADRPLVRIVLDPRGRLPLTSRLVAGAADHPLWLVAPDAPVSHRKAEARGAVLLRCAAPGGRLDLGGLLAELGRRGLTRLLVEGGATTAAAFLRDGLVDRIVLDEGAVRVGAADAVASPVLPGQTPPGFRLTARHRFGTGWLSSFERVA